MKGKETTPAVVGGFHLTSTNNFVVLKAFHARSRSEGGSKSDQVIRGMLQRQRVLWYSRKPTLALPSLTNSIPLSHLYYIHNIFQHLSLRVFWLTRGKRPLFSLLSSFFGFYQYSSRNENLGPPNGQKTPDYIFGKKI